MASKKAAGVDNTFRKTWDKAEFADRAKEREKQAGSDDSVLEARKRKRLERDPLHQGLIIERANLKARDFQIDLAANLNKTRVNALGAPLSQQAGFYCDVCDCILKDSMAYLDHINGKWHNRALGMSMRTERSTTDQVRKRLNELKERKKKSSSANLSAKEGEESEEVHVPDGMSKADLSIGQEKLGRGGINDDGDEEDTHSEGECDKEEEEEDAELSKDASEDIDVASLMGFGNFGGGVKR